MTRIPRVSYQHSAGFKDQGKCHVRKQPSDAVSVFSRRGRVFIAVRYAQAASDVEILNGNAVSPKLSYEGLEAIDGLDNGAQVGQLASDVAVDAYRIEPELCLGDGVDFAGSGHLYAELILLKACRNTWMGFRVHIRVYSDSHTGFLSHGAGSLVEHRKFLPPTRR